MTTEIEISSEQNLPQNDAIKLADIGDLFDFGDGKHYTITSKTFLSDEHDTGPTKIRTKIILERTGMPPLELEAPRTSNNLLAQYMHASDTLISSKGTFKLNHQAFSLRTNGMYFPFISLSPLTGYNSEAEKPNHEHETASENSSVHFVTKNDTIKHARRLGTYFYLEVGVPNTPLYRAMSKELIYHNSTDQLSFKLTLESPGHPTVIWSTSASSKSSIAPYVTKGDAVSGLDANYRVSKKLFRRGISTHLYSVAAGLELID